MDLSAARRNLSSVIPLGLAAAGLVALYYATARPAMLVVDGEPFQLRTHARRPSELLDEAGVEFGPNDTLLPEGDVELSWEGGVLPVVQLTKARPVVIDDGSVLNLIESSETDPVNLLERQIFPGDRLVINGLAGGSEYPSYIQFIRSVPIRLSVEGVERLLHSAAPTLGEALWESGIQLYEGDQLNPLPDTPLTGPLDAQLERSIPVYVHTAEGQVSGRSAANTVAEAIMDTGLQLVGMDYTIPDASGIAPADGEIRIVRVSEEVQIEQEPLRFETLFQPLDTLAIDNQQIVQPGAYGVTTNRIRVRSEDGEEVSRILEGEWVAQEPTPQIIGYGTQIPVRTISTADGALDYWRSVQMYATSYSPSRAGVSPDSPFFGITASGKRLKKGLVAIDRSLIPFGTMMYVPGYGFAEAADTGSGVKGRWIDLGYEDDNWVTWSGFVTVYFLTPIPSPDSIVYIFP